MNTELQHPKLETTSKIKDPEKKIKPVSKFVEVPNNRGTGLRGPDSPFTKRL